uniref:Uncharacterized protein n=1 Tax=Aegilops tauschii subsp. strangulata TaxID=200361 RepID=A0A453RQI9_AEGTS
MEAAVARADTAAFFSGQEDAAEGSMSSLPARVAGSIVRGVITFIFATGRWHTCMFLLVFISPWTCRGVRHLRRATVPDRLGVVAVGTILGAITGGMIGLATESGLVRGAGIGAISGAVVAMEVVDRSMAMWRSDECGIWSVLYVVRA